MTKLNLAPIWQFIIFVVKQNVKFSLKYFYERVLRQKENTNPEVSKRISKVSNKFYAVIQRWRHRLSSSLDSCWKFFGYYNPFFGFTSCSGGLNYLELKIIIRLSGSMYIYLHFRRPYFFELKQVVHDTNPKAR